METDGEKLRKGESGRWKWKKVERGGIRIRIKRFYLTKVNFHVYIYNTS